MQDNKTLQPAPRKPIFTRRRLLLGAAGVLLGGIGTVGYATQIAPYRLSVEQLTIPIPNLPQRWHNKRLVHLSDLHFGRRVRASHLTRAFGIARDLKPDVVAVTGDLLDHDLAYLPQLTGALRTLADRTPVIATLGNHDYGPGFRSLSFADQLTRGMADVGVTVLRNQFHQPNPGPGELTFVGLDDLWARRFNPAVAFATPPVGPAIVLSHNPDTYDALAPHPWDLMLSGHTHGGQVRIPGIGALRLPVDHKDRDRGLFHLDPAKPTRALYVSRGVGHVLRVRLFCSPEVTCITLVNA